MHILWHWKFFVCRKWQRFLSAFKTERRRQRIMQSFAILYKRCYWAVFFQTIVFTVFTITVKIMALSPQTVVDTAYTDKRLKSLSKLHWCWVPCYKKLYKFKKYTVQISRSCKMSFSRNAGLWRAQYLHILNLPCYRSLRHVGSIKPLLQYLRCVNSTVHCLILDANFYLNWMKLFCPNMHISSRVEYCGVQWLTESFAEFAKITLQHKMLPVLKNRTPLNAVLHNLSKNAVDLYAFIEQ